jgi:hypothetical protein
VLRRCRRLGPPSPTGDGAECTTRCSRPALARGGRGEPDLDLCQGGLPRRGGGGNNLSLAPSIRLPPSASTGPSAGEQAQRRMRTAGEPEDGPMRQPRARDGAACPCLPPLAPGLIPRRRRWMRLGRPYDTGSWAVVNRAQGREVEVGRRRRRPVWSRGVLQRALIRRPRRPLPASRCPSSFLF